MTTESCETACSPCPRPNTRSSRSSVRRTMFAAFPSSPAVPCPTTAEGPLHIYRPESADTRRRGGHGWARRPRSTAFHAEPRFEQLGNLVIAAPLAVQRNRAHLLL